MPYMQWLIEGINRLGEERRMARASDELIEKYFGPNSDFVGVLEEAISRSLSDNETRFMAAWPPALGEASRAAMYDAAKRRQRIQVQWVPGYDFELHMWEPRSDGGSPGGLVVQYVTPYPSDPTVGARLEARPKAPGARAKAKAKGKAKAKAKSKPVRRKRTR